MSNSQNNSAVFVPAHILDPNYQFYTTINTTTAPAPPPFPPSLPSQEAATALHIEIPPPPPPRPLMWSSEHVAVLPRPPPPDTRRPDPVSRPLKSSFATCGCVATERTRREQSLSPSPLPSQVVLAPAPAPTVGAPDSVVAEVQLARDRAMKIIQQFQKNDRFRADSEIAQKRKASLEQLKRRKRIAMVKNLEYLAKAEDERPAAKLQQAQEAQNLQMWRARKAMNLLACAIGGIVMCIVICTCCMAFLLPTFWAANMIITSFPEALPPCGRGQKPPVYDDRGGYPYITGGSDDEYDYGGDEEDHENVW